MPSVSGTFQGFSTGYQNPGVIGAFIAAVISFCVALWFLARDVFSLAGLAYSFGLGPADELTWPAATRVVTWVLLYTLCAAVSGFLDWRDGRLAHRSRLHAVQLGYATCIVRAYRRGAWAVTLVKDTVGQVRKPRQVQPARPIASIARAGDGIVIEHDPVPARRDGVA